MDYEKKYNEALERAKKFEEKYGGGYAEYIFPELAESEDEKIRKLLVWQVYRNIEDETNDLAQSVYDGIKGHDPDLEESIEDWKRCLAWLEKQKEKSEIPIMGGDTDTYFDDLRMTTKPLTSRGWFDEGIKYAQKLQKEQKPKAKAKSPLSPHELYDAKIEGISQGRQDVLDHPEQFGLQKPAEWSDEDADMLNCCISSVEEAKENRYAYNETDGNTSYDREIDWLKSLRPSWKPSEGQIEALEAATVRYQSTGLESLYEDLKKL